MITTKVFQGFYGRLFEVKTDQSVVWINGRKRCLARFSSQRVEIHVPDFSKPIFTREKSIDIREWKQFQKFSRDCYGVTLGDEWKPIWLSSLDEAVQSLG